MNRAPGPALLAVPLALVALGGCQRQAAETSASDAGRAPIAIRLPTTPDEPPAPRRGDARVAILALPPAQRQVVLRRAIIDADGDCAAVRGAMRGADVGGGQTWTVDCGGTHGRWMVIIAADGTAQVMRGFAVG